MKTRTSYLCSFLAFGLALAACSKSESNPGTDTGEGELTGQSKYVVAVTPIATSGVADYLLTADDLTQGIISTAGNGVEQDGTYRYYVTHKNKFFSLLYGQGNPGAVTTYNLDAQGKLIKSSDFVTETVHVFAPVNDDLLLIKVPRSGDANALMYKIDANQSLIIGEKQINIESVAGNSERAHFTWATQVGDKVFAPYMSIKGEARGGDTFGTKYPDSTWIAVFSYPDLNLEGIIRDGRTSYIGDYFTDGLFVDEVGDVYGFSPAAATNNAKYTSTNPSAFVRIKQGATAFDQEYFFNFQEATGGYHIQEQTYLGNGKVFLVTYGKPNAFEGIKFAMADVYNKTVKWFENEPGVFEYGQVNLTVERKNRMVADDKKSVFVGLTLNNGESYVYNFSSETMKISRGLKVEGGSITAIQKLNY